MRKVLIGLMMAGSLLTPVVAHAQDDRSEQRAARQERQEARQQRQEGRQEQRAVRPEARQEQVQAAPAQVQVAQRGERRRGGDGNRGASRGNRGSDGGQSGQSSSGYQRGWQGPAGTENSRIADRYNRRAQENAIRHGPAAQRRDAIQDARRDGRSREQIRDWRRDGRDDRRDARQDRRGDRRDWNRGWRSDNRYNWQDWRYRNRNVFRLSPYYSPYRGYGYSRFSIGLVLDRLFYDQRYWLSDPSYYRLPYAPDGTQWVRYYNDVVLVDVYSGEVIDVIHNFFW